MTEETSDLAGLPDKVIHIGEDNGLWGLDAISLGGFVNGTLPQNSYKPYLNLFKATL